MEALGRAVNEAHIYRFLEKPWEPGCLRIDIAQALEWRRVLEENRRLAERYRAQRGESSPPVPAGDYRVLVVDDEEGVLNAVWRELTHHSAYEGLYAALRRDLTHRSVVDTHPVHFVVDTSLSPLDALHRAEEIPYDVVVAHYRMPEMDGVAFLEAFRRVQPDAVAVMLSGHADLAALSAAVNRADIRHFVRKPWSEYELKNALIQALGWREAVLENRRLSEEAKSGTAMVFDSPTRAVSTSPSVSRGLLFAGVLGLVAGIALALVLEALDDTIHTPEDITRDIDINFLGMVPLLDTGVNELITVSAPKSPPAEAYRTLRSNINFSLLEDPASMFLVTSAGSGEGKTVTASNIEGVFAQAGQSVIVVDTDLRRPTLHRLLHGDSSRGLTNILVGEASIEDVLQDTHVEGLKLISSGPLPPNPAEMLDSDPMRRLIQDLKEYADIVIFDSPPAIVLTDAVVLSSKVERTILVAEAGQVTKEAFGEAVRLIRNARGNLLGVVLNKLRLSASDYYYYYYYYDYSHESPRVIAPPEADTEV
jgi:capsular exopolysaccharide synthesis family protein